VAIYDHTNGHRGRVEFFDVRKSPPRFKRPKPENLVGLGGFISKVIEVYDERNEPPWTWEE
jgi:hypothetical protein